MDTTIVSNQSFPILPDSIRVTTDYSSIINLLDSLVIQNGELITKIAVPAADKSVSLDVIFTTLVTISIFYAGIIIDRYVKRKEKLKEQADIRFLYYQYLRKILDSYIPGLLTSFKKIVDETTIDYVRILPPKLLSTDFERISKIGQQDVLKTILENDLLIMILGKIDYVDSLVKEIQNLHYEIVKLSLIKIEKLNDAINTYVRSVNEFITEQEKSGDKNQEEIYYKAISNSLNTFYEESKEEKKFTFFRDKIVSPNQDIIIKSGLHKNNLLAREIINNGKYFMLLCTEFDQLIQSLNKGYIFSSENIKKKQEEIICLMDQINW